MMRLALMAALLVTASGAAAQAADDEIVIAARRISEVSLLLGRDTAGRTTCGLSRSSGDARIDDAMCRRAAKCIKRGSIDAAQTSACVDRQKRALTAAWARGERS